MKKRNDKGQFVKGISFSPETQFKKGQHWRKKQLYWDKDWLESEYIDKFRSALDIANQFNITEAAILFWLRKLGIQRRCVTEIRDRKYWGVKGRDNPMFGKTGKKNPNWKGGVTPERQSVYSSQEWTQCVKTVWKRDNATCKRCGCVVGGGGELFAIHHIVSFAVAELRCNVDNLVLLCKRCHIFTHSKENINNEFLMTYEQFKKRFQ